MRAMAFIIAANIDHSNEFKNELDTTDAIFIFRPHCILISRILCTVSPVTARFGVHGAKKHINESPTFI